MESESAPRVDSTRKHVTKACRACRDSKTKCDGETPQCGSCARKDRVCDYEGREDKRRVSFRPALEVLQRRVALLHSELLKSGILPPPMSAEDAGLANKTLETVGLPLLPDDFDALPATGNDAGPQPAADISAFDTQQVDASILPAEVTAQDPPPTNAVPVVNDPVLQTTFHDAMRFNDLYSMSWDETVSPDWPWMTLFPSELDAYTTADNTHAGGQNAPRLQGRTLAPTSVNPVNHYDGDDEVDQELVGQIAARFGALHVAPDGKLRYFGTATNVHLFNGNRYTGPFSNPRSVKVDGQSLLRNADLHQSIDRDVEQHLIELYFFWHNSCNPVVDKTMYSNSRRAGTESTDSNGYYSEVLTNAMCAIGASYEARYHPKIVTFPRPLAEFFAERAKILLEIELDSPCVSTVQALLLLSSHEIGFQRTARAWLYSGMAMRLCFDLGLHIDTESYVEHGILSALEAQSRQTTFWACYVMNYHTSFSLGRPFTLDYSEITVRKPTVTTQAPRSNWRAYQQVSTGQPSYSQALDVDSRDTPDLISVISEQRILLCDLVEPIARALYGNTQISPQALLQMSEKATSAMFNWKENLPNALLITEDPQSHIPPQLLVLHLEYDYLQILIHRPWTTRRNQPDAPQGLGFRHARQTCVASACEMARLVTIFERRFGCRRIDVETSQMLPSAALILIFAAISVPDQADKDSEIIAHLSSFFRALDELSNVHISARAHLDSLLLIQEQWQRMYKQKRGKRRDSTWQSNGDAVGSSSKRPRGPR